MILISNNATIEELSLVFMGDLGVFQQGISLAGDPSVAAERPLAREILSARAFKYSFPPP